MESHLRINALEKLCSEDVGRNISKLAEHASGGLLSAATSISSHATPYVAILTGFYIPSASPPACETDGPLGAACLARTLTASGIPVRVATDSLSANTVRQALQFSLQNEVSHPHVPLDVVALENSSLNEAWDGPITSTDRLIHNWKTEAKVTHVVSIERAGPARDGNVYNMRGVDISEWNASLDKVMSGGPWTTVGIGDGGNELGMGSLPYTLVEENINLGGRIGCVVPCDHLIVCGVSNWGAWGLAAGVTILRGDPDKNLQPLSVQWSFDCLRIIVEKGPSVDGVTGQQCLSVDGMGWEAHKKILEGIWNIVCQCPSAMGI